MSDDDDFYYDSDLDLTDPGEDDDMDFQYDMNGSQSMMRTTSYDVLDEEELKKRTSELIDNVIEILGLSSRAFATVLLRYFDWNSENLINAYTENSEKLMIDAGIYGESEQKLSKSKKISCPICMTSGISGKDTYALGCGHRYCNTCWSLYLEQQINNGPECIRTTCPYPKCNAVVHEKAFETHVSKEQYKIYQKFLERSIVFDNPFMKFCPSPNCTYTIKCERKNRKETVTCKCGFSFCFQCADYDIGDHMPATCENVQDWLERASSESENIKWMMANTKKCPNCRKPIEKNGGCMHMTCGRNAGGCGYQFCWLCRGPWSEHGKQTGGFFACNRYTESAAEKEDQKNLEIKTELEAYMFYYHRYESHRNALKIADEQRNKADERANKMLEYFKVRTQEVGFLRDATEQLIKNRRVLQWSYVYGYFLRNKSSEKELFEYLQQDLEYHTDKLSGLYEQTINENNTYHEFMEWKESVTNYTRVTSGFLDKFVQGVMSGLTTSNDGGNI